MWIAHKKSTDDTFENNGHVTITFMAWLTVTVMSRWYHFNVIGISNGLNNDIGHGHVRTNGHSNGHSNINGNSNGYGHCHAHCHGNGHVHAHVSFCYVTSRPKKRLR